MFDEICLGDLAGAQVGQVITTLRGSLLAAVVRWLSGMIVVGTGRADMYDGIKVCFFDHMPKHAMRRWAAAYVAHAEKKHAEGRLRRDAWFYWREGLVHSFFCRDAPLVGCVLGCHYSTS